MKKPSCLQTWRTIHSRFLPIPTPSRDSARNLWPSISPRATTVANKNALGITLSCSFLYMDEGQGVLCKKTFVKTRNSRVGDSMSDDFSKSQEESPLERIRRLASSMLNGEAYERWPDIEAEDRRVLGLNRSEWFR